MKSLLFIVVVSLIGSSDAIAQQPAADTQAPTQDVTYRRETLVYPSAARRNPFTPLGDQTGPNFETLDVVGIIFAGSGGSVATLIDRATEQRYRVRRGDVIGNARVVEVQPDALVFQVTVFGVTRAETLKIGDVSAEEGG